MTNREIKFRAWLTNVGIMLSVYVLDQTGNAGRGTHFETSKGYSEHNAQFVFNIDDAQLMQFTGLKDKNGNPIYESDILSDGKYNWEVYWHVDHACFAMKSETVTVEIINNENMTVIGNIYENENLLK